MNAPTIGASRPRRQPGLSYKFQRLREKIRRAIETGELTGKLPGERTLASRFRANAKTISKALTDLAAEGLLDRTIGRGTYVKGSGPAQDAAPGRWLVLCDAGQEDSCTAWHLRQIMPELRIACSMDAIRPSLLSQFSAVIDLAGATPQPLLRDLLVRGMPVVAVNREPRNYSVHCVSVDAMLGVSRVARDVMLLGHRKFAAIGSAGAATITHALRLSAARYSREATVETCEPNEAAAAVQDGATVVICGSVRDARACRAALAAGGIKVPEQVSLAAVGCACPEAQCSGYFVPCEQIAEAIADILRQRPARPASLWLAGAFLDRGTLAPMPGAPPIEHPAPPRRVSGVAI